MLNSARMICLLQDSLQLIVVSDRYHLHREHLQLRLSVAVVRGWLAESPKGPTQHQERHTLVRYCLIGVLSLLTCFLEAFSLDMIFSVVCVSLGLELFSPSRSSKGTGA